MISVAVLSSAADVSAYQKNSYQITVKVINNTKKDIILQNGLNPEGLRNIDTIKAHTTKPITFSGHTSGGARLYYKFPNVQDWRYSNSFLANDITADITFNG